MKSVNIEDALQTRPFRPFTVELDSGKQIRVQHLDFVFLSPSKGTAVIFEFRDKEEHYSIVDVENISAISLIKKNSA